MKINFKHLLTLVLGFVFVALVVACTPEATQFTVTFNSHGGTNVASQTVDEGSLLNEPTPPTRSGYTFEGWYKEAAYNNEWNFEVDTVASNLTLHAKWEAIDGASEFTITFNAQGGAAVTAVTRAAGAQIGTLPTTTRAGFTFGGWHLDAAGTEPVVTTAAVTANLTVYAKWTPTSGQTFTVTFNPGAGDVLPPSRTVAAGATVAAPDAEYLGYELAGWFTENTFVNEWNFETDVVEANMTLYAKWELIPDGVGITTRDEFYNLVSGATTYNDGADFYLRFDLDFTDFEWDATGWTGDNVPLHNFNFNGNGKRISNLTFTTPSIGGLFARMDGGSVFDLTIDNVHITTGAQAAVLVGRVMRESEISFTDITILNSSATGGAPGVGALIGHVQGEIAGLDAKTFVEISSIVVLNTNLYQMINIHAIGGLIGDIESSEVTATDLLLDVVVTASGNSERVGGIVGEVRKNSAETADWPSLTIDSAVVFANLTGARYLGGIVGRADSNMTSSLPGEFTNVILVLNYDTLHVSDNNNGHISRSNVPAFDDIYVVAFNYDRANLNGVNVAPGFVFADVEALPTNAAVGFSSNWSMSANALPTLNGYAIDLGHKVTLTVGETSQTQYVRDGQAVSPIYINPALGAFFGWFAGETLFVGPVTADVTLTAVFAEEYTVSFESNGGSAVVDQVLFAGAKATEPTDPTRFGYTFDGWFTSAELTTLFDFDTAIEADVTLYAGWTAVILDEFTVTFETNGGSAVEPITVLEGATAIMPAHPTKDEFVFAGWFVDAELETPFIVTTPITADITLYAKWEDETGSGEIPEGFVGVSTVEEFYALVSDNTDGKYFLLNDLDFGDYTWVAKNSTFSGVFDGNNHTISNITINAVGVDGVTINAIFTRLGAGAEVKNLVIDNADITTGNVAGILAAQADGVSTISNIVIKNSSVEGAQNNGTAALLGRAMVNVTITNISVIDTYALNTQKNVAAIVGRIEGGSINTIVDIFISGFHSEAVGTGNDSGIGYIVGYTVNAVSNTAIDSVVIINSQSTGQTQGLIGYYRGPSVVSMTNVYAQVAFNGATRSGVTFHNNTLTEPFDVTSVYGEVTGIVTHATMTTFLPANLVSTAALDQPWWATNLPTIASSLLWEFDADLHVFVLKNA